MLAITLDLTARIKNFLKINNKKNENISISF